jgi:hypothetical protein
MLWRCRVQPGACKAPDNANSEQKQTGPLAKGNGKQQKAAAATFQITPFVILEA